jgi:hypothetical protein
MADGSDVPEDGFNALLGRALRREDRERLTKVRNALGIRANDAVWDVMIALPSSTLFGGAETARGRAAEARGGGCRPSRVPGRQRARQCAGPLGRWPTTVKAVALVYTGGSTRRHRGRIRSNLHRPGVDYGRSWPPSLGCRGPSRRRIGGAGRVADLSSAPACGFGVGGGGLGSRPLSGEDCGARGGMVGAGGVDRLGRAGLVVLALPLRR